MQEMERIELDFELITPSAKIATATHGGRAKCLQRLLRLELPVPKTVAISFSGVHSIAAGHYENIKDILTNFGTDDLLCVRPSSESSDWGGPSAIMNIGMNNLRYEELKQKVGPDLASSIYINFIQAYSLHVARLDPDIFNQVDNENSEALAKVLEIYENETEQCFPQDIMVQLSEILRSMARTWESTTARLLRQAKGAPIDAGLGLVIQVMAFGLGEGECGTGILQLIDENDGKPKIKGRYKEQSQIRPEKSSEGALYLTKDKRGWSLEDNNEEIFGQLVEFASLMRVKLREEMQIEFSIQNGVLHILDGIRTPRRSQAAVRVAVRLAEDGIISRSEALMRVEPRAISELLHRQIDPEAHRQILGSGVAASPGAATGRIVFSAEAAQSHASRGIDCILVRRETSPEDVRGMHAAVGVLTERGGITSHAAVIGRGIGLPCVVGVKDIRFQTRRKTLICKDGRQLTEGDEITIDGTRGDILFGSPKMVEAALDDAFQTLLEWTDEVSEMKVRANADTPQDALTAKKFNAQGIGLCRTEHMFFESDRLTVMREMIFSKSAEDRRLVLERLLPMQRKDFIELFEIMKDLPVCIRLFDPPLHEFLPSDRDGMHDLAEALGLPLSDVVRRVEAMGEYNPMLGMRGVRLGVTVPEIYEMQARAIFEAIVHVFNEGISVIPEIMIPLVSAKREVELVKKKVASVASQVSLETSKEVNYKLGVMVETPRAALRASDIAMNSEFLSFGTNDLTQMAYGLSRDDAGRFMSQYVQQGVFQEDPFHILDAEGVGELVKLGADRARSIKSDITLSICGEHGGNPESIAFCHQLGFHYVSCSPYRVPVAKLAAAQVAISTVIS
tara:strand:- start:4461 stop:7007 length:2547 start_codon:yes stop_codon:yes gene_type:complete